MTPTSSTVTDTIGNKRPAISILVPCYNVEKYLRECLDSIVNQTLKEIEIICLNDGSKDNTLNIINEYAAKDQRIIVVDKPNSGYGATMNIGLQKANGKYIGIVESDDFIEKEMFEHMYEAAEKNHLDLVRCLYREINEVTGEKQDVNFEKFNTYRCNEIFKPREQKNIFLSTPSIWAGLYRKDFLDKNGIRFLETPGASFQDTAFAFKCYAMADKVMVLREFLHNYRINEGSSVTSSGKVYFICDEDAEIRRYAKEKGIYDELKEVLALRAFGSYRWNYERLAKPLKREFIKKWSADVKEMYAEKSITSRYFSIERRFRLWLIANCPWIYYFAKKI